MKPVRRSGPYPAASNPIPPTYGPMMNSFRLLVLFLWTMLANPPGAASAELRVLAAASLSDALQEVGEHYTETTGNPLRFSFGSSGALTRQIREGAPADVFVSADALRMDQLESGALLLDGSRRTILRNALVLIVNARQGSPMSSLQDLTGSAVQRLALGEPATVPAGTYAKTVLEQVGLWELLLPKIIPLHNVRSVLAAVEAGNADAGFVYQTDARVSNRVTIALSIPDHLGPDIRYPAAVLEHTEHAQAALEFVAFLASPAAQGIFAAHGFLPMP